MSAVASRKRAQRAGEGHQRRRYREGARGLSRRRGPLPRLAWSSL